MCHLLLPGKLEGIIYRNVIFITLRSKNVRHGNHRDNYGHIIYRESKGPCAPAQEG
jgi:hypothetical protein